MSDSVKATRTNSFLLAEPEKRFLQKVALKLPARVMPDHMTALGLGSAVLFAVCGALSVYSDWWLVACALLLATNWFGDSMDGNLARARGHERPKYGYYLDHAVDALATSFYGIGLGLSTLMHFHVGMLFVVVYLIMSINVYLEAQAFGRFDISYGRLGPTEARIILATLLLICAAVGSKDIPVYHGNTAVDWIFYVVAAGGILGFVAKAIANLRQLAKMEPAFKAPKQ